MGKKKNIALAIHGFHNARDKAREQVSYKFQRELRKRGFVVHKKNRYGNFASYHEREGIHFLKWGGYRKMGYLVAGCSIKEPEQVRVVTIYLVDDDPEGFCTIGLKCIVDDRTFERRTPFFKFELIEEVADLLDMLAAFLIGLQKYSSLGYRADKNMFNDFFDQVTGIINDANIRPVLKDDVALQHYYWRQAEIKAEGDSDE